jgi:hypothetical protein
VPTLAVVVVAVVELRTFPTQKSVSLPDPPPDHYHHLLMVVVATVSFSF